MELGSEFHIDLTDLSVKDNTIYALLKPYHTFYTDYGRTAISLLYEYLQKHAGKKILLPSYICDSVVKSFPKDAITFYELQENFVIDEATLNAMIDTDEYDGGIFYLNHYFGAVQPLDMLERLQKLCREHQITIIEDTTHSIFTKTRTIGDYCIASLRKWMPIPEGAVVYSMQELPEEWKSLERAKPSAKIEAMVLKKLFLGQNTSYKDLMDAEKINEAYRQIFVTEEEKIEAEKDGQEKACAISDLSAFLLQCQDVIKIQENRKRNYLFLKEQLAKHGISLYGHENLLENSSEIMKEEIIPYTALLKLKEHNRNDFRKYLMEQKIYCAVHWPIEIEEQHKYAHVSEWAEELISLPIDQRYEEEEMKYLAETILAWFAAERTIFIK